MKKVGKRIRITLIIILSIVLGILLFIAYIKICPPSNKDKQLNSSEFKYQDIPKEENNLDKNISTDLEILPTNYLDIIQKNNLNIEQRNRVELLRYGQTIINQQKSGNYQDALNSLLSNETPILINNQILTIHFITQLTEIRNNLIQKDFKRELSHDLSITNSKISVIKILNGKKAYELNILQSKINRCIADLRKNNYEDCIFTLNNLDDSQKKLLESTSRDLFKKVSHLRSLFETKHTEIFKDLLDSNDLIVINDIQSKNSNSNVEGINTKVKLHVDINVLNRMIALSEHVMVQLDQIGIQNSKLLNLKKDLITLKEDISSNRYNQEVLKKILFSQQYDFDTVQYLLTTVKEENGNIIFVTPYISKTTSTPVINDNNILEEYDIAPLPIQSGVIRLPIMMYHNISDPVPNDPYKLYVTPDIFERQIAYLVKKNYKILNVEEFNTILSSGETPKQKSILLTFDDATPTHYSVAYPILKKYGQTGVFFMIASRSLLKHPQIKEMSDGGMYIESHSNTHAYFNKISNSMINEEMALSKSIIEGITGKSVSLFAYPGCAADHRSFDIAKNNGYKAAFTCGQYIDINPNQRYYISRVHPYNDMESFIKMISVGL